MKLKGSKQNTKFRLYVLHADGSRYEKNCLYRKTARSFKRLAIRRGHKAVIVNLRYGVRDY